MNRFSFFYQANSHNILTNARPAAINLVSFRADALVAALCVATIKTARVGRAQAFVDIYMKMSFRSQILTNTCTHVHQHTHARARHIHPSLTSVNK